MADITFTGNLGADALLKFTPGGHPILEMRVADTKSKKLDNGEWEEIATQWLNVAVWGKLAEHLAEQGITKGTRVKVVGEFYAREFEHNGVQRQSLDVRAWGVDVFQKRGQSQARSAPQQARSGPPSDPWAKGGQSAAVDPWGQASTDGQAPF